MVFLVLILIVAGVVLSFADIGGGIILNMAEKYLRENYNILLKAESLTGNPIKGYTLNNFKISDEKEKEILSAEFLSGRLNFSALIKGKIKLAEISTGGIKAEIERLIDFAQKFQIPTKTSSINFSISPAFADEKNDLPEIPLDVLNVINSQFSSKFGKIDVNNVTADLNNFDIDVDAKFNDLPIKGKIDMGETAGLTAINKSELSLGTGKILATGGLIDEKLDFHASLEDLNLKEITALYPSMLKAEDFNGELNFNADISGKIDNPKLSGNVDYKGSEIYGFPVERVSSNFNYSDYRIGLSDIQANILNVPIQGEIAVANRPNEKTSVMIKLDGSEANLDGLDKVLNIPELKALSGKVSTFNANITGHVDSLNGLVNFTAPRIAYDGKALTNIRTQLKLSKSDTAHVDGKFNFEGSNGYLQGSIASILINPKFNLNAKIVELDVKRISDMIPDASDYKLAGKITASVSVKGTSSNPSISGSLNSPEFSGFGQKITKPVINFAFANKTLTLSKTEGTFNGMPINLSGTVSPLPSTNPNLNINATIAMSPSALKNYVPDIEQYSLKGTVNAGIKIQGNVEKPSINLVASSSNLEALKMISARDIELTTALNGDLTKLEKINVKASAKRITASGITISDLSTNINKNLDKITLSDFTAKSGSGSVTGSGNASVSGKENLNFNFNFNNLELAPLAAASGVDLKGVLTGNLKISGTNTNPAINFNAKVPSINAQGFLLSNLTADISGNMNNIKLNKVRAEVEGVEVLALGDVQISPALKLNIALKGNNIKLEKLLAEYPAMKNSLFGVANVNFNITGNDKNISGNGALTSSAIKAWGLNLTNINLPLSYLGNTFASKNGTANLYGGTAKNTFNFDIKNMKFSDNIEASGVNVNSLIQDVSGGLEGKITGTGKLTMKINGAVKDSATYSGSGNFSMGSGGISGFKWLDLLTKIHNTNGINYVSVNAPLTLQTGKLILNAGSIVKARDKDPIYTYAKLSQNGIIDFSGKDVTLNLMTESNINYQLINAIQGGSSGGFSALFKGGVSNFQDGVKAFLTGGLEKAKQVASTGDFRIVTLKISGKAVSPSFSNLKIGASTLKNDTIQSTEVNQNQEKFKEKVIDRAVEVIAPKNVKQETKEKIKQEINKNLQNVTPQNIKTKTEQVKQQVQQQVQQRLKQETQKVINNSSQNQNKTQTQTQQNNNQTKRQQIENQVKESVKNEIKKGLGGLFKR